MVRMITKRMDFITYSFKQRVDPLIEKEYVVVTKNNIAASEVLLAIDTNNLEIIRNDDRMLLLEKHKYENFFKKLIMS